MNNLVVNFDGRRKGFSPEDKARLFSNEENIRNHRAEFRQNAYAILERRNLPMAHVALTMYLSVKNDCGSNMRKDKITPREQHEESHLETLDALINTAGDGWISSSQDVIFTATILHDVIEDFYISENQIRQYLETGLKNLLQNNTLSENQYATCMAGLPDAIHKVSLLSRKNADGSKIAEQDRVLQAKRWLEDPEVYVIKMIDWLNKLQTLVGVENFEKDGFKKFGKVIDETGFLFVDEQQGMTRRAVHMYPEIAKACEPLEGVMGILFQTLNTYKKIKTDTFPFSPETAFTFNFANYLEKSEGLLRNLVRGNNYISPALDRLAIDSQKDPRVKTFLSHMILPSFPEFLKNENLRQIQFENKSALYPQL